MRYALKKLKIIAALLCAVCGLFLAVFTQSFYSAAADTVLVPVVPEIPYALIKREGVILYGTDKTSGALYGITELPQSYFVSVTGEHDAEFYRALYGELTGLVKKTDVRLVDYEPVTKFALGNLTAADGITGMSCYARPGRAANIVGEVKGNQTVQYYGKIAGGTDNADASLWYFVVLPAAPEAESINAVTGYLYAEYTAPSPIPENVIEKVMQEQASTDPSIGETAPAFPPYVTAIFIACLSLPAVIVMALLFKRPKPKKREARF